MKQRIFWFGIFFGTSCAINLLIELISRKSLLEVGSYIWHSPTVFLLNTFIILFPFSIAFLTRHKLFIIGVLFLTWVFMGSINGILLIFRTTPFTAADLRLFKYALSMVDSYLSWWQISLIIIGIVVSLAGSVWLWKKAPIDRVAVSLQVACICGATTFLAIIGISNWCLAKQYISNHYGNIGQAYREYGFAYCFSNSLFHTGIPKPETYGVEVVNMIEQESLVPANTYELSQNQAPNIIMIQLESFFDPALWDGYQKNKNPIPFFSYLRQYYPTGFLSVPSVGAGTANTEFECITGMNLDFFGPGEYPYKTVLQKTACESIAFDLKKLGYRTHAIHNNEGTFYDRHIVFSQLGFDTFTPIEYMNGIERNPTGWCKDKILTNEIVKILDSTPKADFIYAITVQGHGAYPDFNYFCEQLNEVDNFIKDLIVTLNDRVEPTVVVLYGDHLPGFEWTEEEMKNKSLYQTEYVIWNNLNLPRAERDLEAYQMAAYLLDLLNIHEGTMMRYHQKYLKSTDIRDQDYLAEMEILEYDILYGDRSVYEGDLPFQPTKLQMGTMPVVVDLVVHNGDNLLVFGENFNQYSVICINDKPLETLYAGTQLLIVKNLPKKLQDEPNVTVQQIGRDKIPLGTAGM